MNIVTRTIIGCTAAIMTLAAVSCSKDNTLRYNNATMGNIVDGRFVSDQGNTFNIVEQNYTGKIDTMHRAFMLCDILNATEGATDEYDVRVNYLASVLTKDPVVLSENTDEEKLVNDAIILSDLWISGGYVNAILTIPIKNSVSTPHMINFIYDDTEKEEGTYTFLIRHNAFGDVLKENSNDNYNMVLANAFVSFPITSTITEETAKMIIKWQGYKIVDSGIVSSNSQEYQIERTYTNDAFEKVPSNVKTSATLYSVK
ncbi:MAG: hypothetical protein IKU33_01960 [Bacteroidales bacterium]|nr:hypothetical protein [Bacteroidales bacterium]